MANDTVHSNQLAGEKSPYLLQHQHNPVHWLPWGEAAFDLARAEDKPIFLSIGYSTCHWCHVMERESFENEEVARIMNENFVNIKVDREERPDVDHVHMTFVQATTGSGGWPMSVFLTPDLKPFFGGTYFPPDDRYGRPGFSSLLKHIAATWQNDRARVEESGESVVRALGQYATSAPPAREVDWEAVAKRSFSQLVGGYDSIHGGFGEAPKFPRPVIHDFLHRYYAATADEVALHASCHTLRAMEMGGINDQLGGGFHRYSVDDRFIVSHFEKMLYDQAQLVIAYLEAYQLTGDADFAATARATLDYVLRDMTHPEGGFFAAEDADSLPASTATHKDEGAFYVWTQAELAAALGADDAAVFGAYYGVRAEGNAPEGGDPHGEFVGKNILYRAMSAAEAGIGHGKSEAEVNAILQRGRAVLLAARAQRPRPHRDEKIIVAWNGLMISAFARATTVLAEPRYADAARRAADFIERELFDPQDATLRRHWQGGPAAVPGFADDYAALARGLLDLYQATGTYHYLAWAERLSDSAYALFWDAAGGGYFNSAPDKHVLLRLKEDYDGAEPAAGSLAAMNDLRLGALLDRDDLTERGDATLHAFAARVQLIPQAMPELLCAALFHEAPPLHIVLVGDAAAADTRALRRVIDHLFLPDALIVHTDGTGTDPMAQRLPFVAAMKKSGESATAYVCRDFACREAVTDPAALGRELPAAPVPRTQLTAIAEPFH